MNELEILFLIIVLIIFIFIFLFIISICIYHKYFLRRYDTPKSIKLYTYKDFKGIQSEEFQFDSNSNVIKGRIYYLKNKTKLKNKVIFFYHGIGGGHFHYMHEIYMFVKEGYYVFSYDNLGCDLSGGKSIKGLLESIIESINFYKFYNTLDKYKDYDIYLVGHSWGAFTAIISSNFIKCEKVVGISSFNSASFPSKGNLLILKILRPFFFFINYVLFKKYSLYSVKKTIKLNQNIQYLLINGRNDKVVFPNQSSNIYSKLDYSNLFFKELDNKGHSPQLDILSEKYLISFLKDSKNKGFDPTSYDYDLLTTQDEYVYKMIFKFFSNQYRG